MSRLKEPHFFNRRRPAYLPTVSDEESYLRLFDGARAGQLRGEASASYLVSSHASHAIARVRPDARILVVLREPVARAYSSYLHQMRYGRESRTFREAIQANLAVPVGQGWRATHTAGGLYAANLARYLELFGSGVLVLFFEEIAADTRGEVRRAFRFLGVDEDEADRIGVGIRNAAGLPRNAPLRRAYASTRLRSVGARVVPNVLQPRLERLLLRRPALPPIDAETRRLLDELYAPEAEELERLLGRPVPWAGVN